MKLKTPFSDLLPPLASVEYDALRESLKRGYDGAPIVIDEENNILDGHHRYRLCPDAPRRVKAGLSDAEKQAFVYQSNLARRNMSPEQKREALARMKAIALALKQEKKTQAEIGAMLGVDQGTVSRWLDTTNMQPHNGSNPPIPDSRVKVPAAARKHIYQQAKKGAKQAQLAADFGVSQQTVSKIVKGEARKQADEQARQAEAQAAPGTARIELADALDWLARQDAYDLLLTDPPYSTDVDDIDAFAGWLPLALSRLKPTGRAYVFVGAYPNELRAYLNTALPEQVLVWEYRNTIGPKPAGAYKLNWQAILYYVGPDAPPLNCDQLVEQFSVQNVNAPDGRHAVRYHAWEKPQALGELFIRHATAPGAWVADPFAGTGTFLLAAAALGRIGIGCDHDDDQIATAQDRGVRRA